MEGCIIVSKKIPKIAVALSALALLLPGVFLVGGPDTAAAATSASAYGRISVSGSDITVDGDASAQFFGVVDTTALQFAILAYVEGETQYAGKTSVFNGPDTSDQGYISQNANAEEFWSQYFALLEYYDCNLVRIGAGDSWGSQIEYRAWTQHHDAYLSLLETMLEQAEAHNVWVVLVLAGSQEYPTYTYGGSGSVFDTGSTAYANYVEYCNEVMAALEDYDGLGWYDLFNEPDHNNCYANYWSSHGGKTAFHAWASAVAADTADASTHPRSMGVAGYGNMFGWSQSDFDLATGTVGFEIASRHYYASASDASLFSTPEQWAENDNIPLFWGELAYNAVYPLTRWTFGEEAIYANGGQAIASMVLTGTSGYPYTGGGIVGTGDDADDSADDGTTGPVDETPSGNDSSVLPTDNGTGNVTGPTEGTPGGNETEGPGPSEGNGTAPIGGPCQERPDHSPHHGDAWHHHGKRWHHFGALDRWSEGAWHQAGRAPRC